MSEVLAVVLALILFEKAEDRLPTVIVDLLWGTAYLIGAVWLVCYAFGITFPPTPYF